MEVAFFINNNTTVIPAILAERDYLIKG